MYKNDVEEHLLVNLHELLIPLPDISKLHPSVKVIIVVVNCGKVVLVVLAPLEDLAKDGLSNLGVAGLVSEINDDACFFGYQ